MTTKMLPNCAGTICIDGRDKNTLKVILVTTHPGIVNKMCPEGCNGICEFICINNCPNDTCIEGCKKACVKGGCRKSFTKGKIDKVKNPNNGKTEKESNLKTAFRETFEESGLLPSNVELACDKDNNPLTITEYTDKQMPNVTYYITEYTDTKDHIFIFDKKELLSSKWYTIDDVYSVPDSKFHTRRKDVLRKALEYYSNKETVRIPATKFISDGDIINKSVKESKKENIKTIRVIGKSTKEFKTAEDRFTCISKTLTWILRHMAVKFNLNISEDGYVLLSDIFNLEHMKDVTIEDVKHVVSQCKKQRLSLTELAGEIYIRANQGHSKDVGENIKDDILHSKIKNVNGKFIAYDNDDNEVAVIEKCIHGTNLEAYKSIKDQGLSIMTRRHIHFALNENAKSGFRPDSKVLIYINIGRVLDDNIALYMSENGVILTDGVNGVLEPKYFDHVEIL
jgi:2'-phosphotransferase